VSSRCRCDGSRCGGVMVVTMPAAAAAAAAAHLQRGGGGPHLVSSSGVATQHQLKTAATATAAAEASAARCEAADTRNISALRLLLHVSVIISTLQANGKVACVSIRVHLNPTNACYTPHSVVTTNYKRQLRISNSCMSLPSLAHVAVNCTRLLKVLATRCNQCRLQRAAADIRLSARPTAATRRQ
jgi:hypothetical protein